MGLCFGVLANSRNLFNVLTVQETILSLLSASGHETLSRGDIPCPKKLTKTCFDSLIYSYILFHNLYITQN